MLKVLLVDDEPFILQGLSVLIDWRSEGYDIVGKAGSAREALAAIQKENPDLVLSDICMPQMSGLELLEEVRRDSLSHAYFVMMSGYSDFEYARAALKCGCIDYLLKPINRVELLNILRRVRELKAEEERRLRQKQLYQWCLKELSGEEYRCIFDISIQGENHDVGIIYSDELLETARGLEVGEELKSMDGPNWSFLENRVGREEIDELIHAVRLNRHEVLRFISRCVFEQTDMEEGRNAMTGMLLDYGDYLMQLRKKQSLAVLDQIESDIRTNYRENLTLKDMGAKYFVNAAYLGQIFKKQYGESFKNYLNRIRIEYAEDFLLHTDMKIYEIAERIGYNDSDYFINRFLAFKGCTPTKFRRQNQE